ncbi:MAG TPA: fluoride efflux transporter CrcB [Mycobacteriales bacterium]|nr:fluoride efflux transporter CrcB [Mycobacteriales bacterium]
MSLVWAVAAAGAVGAPARYLVDTAVTHRWGRRFPLGTFVINTSGALLLGFITGLVLYHGVGTSTKVVIGTGFCGAYTTFSTLWFEVVRLSEDGERPTAVRYLVLSTVTGLAAAAGGLALAAL